MGAFSTGTIWSRGLDILNTTVDKTTGTILAFLGDVKTGEAYSDFVEWWQHVGFASRPPNPNVTTKKASQALVMNSGIGDAVIASRDVRGQAIYGKLGPGETCIYASGADGTAQGRILLKGDSSITMYTQNGAGGTSVAIQLKPDGSISLFGPMGGITIGSTGISLVGASGSGMSLGADGTVAINCDNFVVNGKSISLSGNLVYLGKTATLASAVVHSPPGVPATPASAQGSTSVFVGI